MITIKGHWNKKQSPRHNVTNFDFFVQKQKKKKKKKKEIPLFLKKRGLKLDSFGIQTLNFMNAGWKH